MSKFETSPNSKQIQSTCRRQNECDRKFNFVLGSVENIVGKGENAGLLAFSSFSTVFSKAFFIRVL